MIRTAALAFAAAALFSAPALAETAPPSVNVSIAGKSPAEAHAAIVKAASKVCLTATRGESMFVYVYPSCVQDAVSRAEAGTTLADASKSKTSTVQTAGR
jgi:hypothetical protein